MRRIDNQIDVISKTFLGLTVACARCHDHKFDPITNQDYYALAGFLRSSRHQQAFIDPPRADRPGDRAAAQTSRRRSPRSWRRAVRSRPGRRSPGRVDLRRPGRGSDDGRVRGLQPR